MKFAKTCAHYLVIATLLVVAPGWAASEPIRICLSDVPYPPFIFPDHEGSIQWLLRHAAIRAELSIEFVPIPIKRCVAEISSGKIAARIAGDTPVTRASLKFPTNGSVPDPQRSLGFAREMAFRVKGSKVNWDGHQFSNLEGVVLMQPGFGYVGSLLQSVHVSIDTGGKTLDVNFQKLLAGRGSVAIGYDFYAPFLLARPEFADKVEMLPIPVYESNYYLAFAPDYYQSHAADVERLWTAVGEIRHTAAYEAFKQSVIDASIEAGR